MTLDLLGHKYNRLEVIRFYGKARQGSRSVRLWECLCVCGNTVITDAGHLRSGNTTSCGCAHIDAITKHNRSRSPEYRIWLGMHQRCREDAVGNQYHGAKGVRVCEEWKSFERFLADMGERPTPDHTIDRIDNDGNYERGNCRWATETQQQRNKGLQKNNTSGATGVSWHERHQRWYAHAKRNGKSIYLGHYPDVESADAAKRAFDAADTP